MKTPVAIAFTILIYLGVAFAATACVKKATYANIPKKEKISDEIAQGEAEGQITEEDASAENPTVQEMTAAQTLAEVVVFVPEKKEAGTIAVEAERGLLMGQKKAATAPTASGGGYVSTPSVDPETDTIEDVENSMDVLRYKFAVPQAGNYRVFVKISAPTEVSDEVFVSLDQGATFVPMLAPLTAESEFVWVEVNDGGDVLENAVPLIAGDFTLEFRRLEAGLKIDALAVTTNPAFTGTDIITTDAVQGLRFDVSRLCGATSAALEVEVALANESYVFKNPKILSEETLMVKGITFSLNQLQNPSLSGFADVEARVQPNDTLFLSTAELTVPRAKGPELDQFAFGFGECSVLAE